MAEIELLTQDHFDRFDWRDIELARVKANPEGFAHVAAMVQHPKTKACAVIHNGLVIGIMGFFELWPGVLEMFAFPSRHVHDYAMIYLKTARRYVDLIWETVRPHRMQSNSLADTTHDRWMRFLGFECETPNGMRGYSALKQTFNSWAKVREDIDNGR